MVVIIMGVAGSGKTTVGKLLARELHCAFLDADSLHPAANIKKMSQGIPLNDTDREPWLIAVRHHVLQAVASGENLVVACSALKQRYREFLARDISSITWVYLKGSEDVIRRRLEVRLDHFMKPGMLASQFADLEEPVDAITVDVGDSPATIVQTVLAALSTMQLKDGASRRRE